MPSVEKNARIPKLATGVVVERRPTASLKKTRELAAIPTAAGLRTRRARGRPITTSAVDGRDMSDEPALAAGGTGVQLAKSTSEKGVVFTNCGKAGDQETPAKRAKHKLTRVPFEMSRLMEFCARRELVNQTGHNEWEWPLVILKELVDNAIDASEEAEIAPVVTVTVKRGSVVIEDNGPGIPRTTIEGVLNYSIRVSSREAYVSPTRGAQGNALKTILPMAYVLDERRGEEASGETIIEAHGIAHHIAFAVDHIRQEPKIRHTTQSSPVVRGTRVTVKLRPGGASWRHPSTRRRGPAPLANCVARGSIWILRGRHH
jgi:Histidine kinase-, DNA gyrase B-, and HSP90-like ATPase